MSDTYKRVKGFADIHDSMAQIFHWLEITADETFSKYGYNELRTPIVEFTELFKRTIGDETDVVQKEMFTFPDRKGRSLTLRPEATAGVMRACIEENLVGEGQVTKLFTIGPMFRYERPQKGRMRQFHQINCECLGIDSPVIDAEIISMLWEYLKKLDLKNLKLNVNSLGCAECRPAYLEKLKSYLQNFGEDQLCADCLRRRESNPLRTLDCKQPECRRYLNDAPRLFDYNCPSCKEHFEKTTRLLSELGIEWSLDPWLVRGLDYYQKLAFEVVSEDIGSQTAVAGGGRYNGLLKQLGGPDLPGVGFACGMERLALLTTPPVLDKTSFFMIAPGEKEIGRGFIITEKLRNMGIAGIMNYTPQSFKSLMRQANKMRVEVVLILGEAELEKGALIVKNMKSGEQAEFSQQDILSSPSRIFTI